MHIKWIWYAWHFPLYYNTVTFNNILRRSPRILIYEDWRINSSANIHKSENEYQVARQFLIKIGYVHFACCQLNKCDHSDEFKSKSTLMLWIFWCTVDEKKWNPPIYFNTNYRREMKLVPIIIYYCLL